MLRLHRLHLENYRCFAGLDLSFEPDVTVLFAENGGGKTALLTALAMGLALLQPQHPKDLDVDAVRDTRRVRGAGDRWEPAGPCTLEWAASIGTQTDVVWKVTVSPTSSRQQPRIGGASRAIEQARKRGARWPLIGYYGTARALGKRRRPKKPGALQDRSEGYTDCLDPSAPDTPLLDWLRGEGIGNVIRQARREPARHLADAVLNALGRATPAVSDTWYDTARDTLMTRFDTGYEASWAELSDGYHTFMSLVGDIARRAVILNGQDGADAPLLVEGVVLVDEIDQHLHPRWQRVVLLGLQAAFPRLQFIVTTHSPQVLSSAKNRQVRKLASFALQEGGVFVDGRDSNAILRELMHTDDRGEAGVAALRELHAAIDDGQLALAQKLLSALRARWGDMDPALIRAAALLGEEG